MPQSSKGKGPALRNGKGQYSAGDDKVVLSLYLAAVAKPAPRVCDRQKVPGVCLQNTRGWFIRALTLGSCVGAKHWQKQCHPLAILIALRYTLALFQRYVCSTASPAGHAPGLCRVRQRQSLREAGIEKWHHRPPGWRSTGNTGRKLGKPFSSPSLPAMPRFGRGLWSHNP